MEKKDISLQQLHHERVVLLERVVAFFSQHPGVVGLLLAGSIPGGSADAYSDIDLRVFTTPDSHAEFVNNRLEIPLQWGELLFNEWMDGTEVCVSHFRPFIKIDVFYWNIETLAPSAWFNLPSDILLDRDGVLSDFLARCASINFEQPTNSEVSRITSKALACAHESLRRSRRGELFYAQSLLENLRNYLVQLEDWINQFKPQIALDLKLESRISHRLEVVLQEAYPPLDAAKIEKSLVTLCVLLSDQIIDIHKSFTLDRVVENDIAAVELIINNQVAHITK